MEHDKNVVKYLKKLHGKKSTKEKYLDEIRILAKSNGYEMLRLTSGNLSSEYLVIYREKDKKLLCYIKCGYFNHEIYGTYDLKFVH